MYGNFYPTASAAKSIVIFLLLIVAVVVILTLAASGNFGPKADALAEQIKVQTWINAAREALELRFKEATYEQQLAHNERMSALSLSLVDWGTRVLLGGLVLAAVILAAGKSVQWVYQAQSARVASSAQVAASIPVQPTQPSASTAGEAVRMRNVYTLLEQMNAQLQTLQHQVANTQSQVMATQRRLEQLEIHGNGSDPNKIIPFKSAVG